jgi:hypothetical protein
MVSADLDAENRLEHSPVIHSSDDKKSFARGEGHRQSFTFWPMVDLGLCSALFLFLHVCRHPSSSSFSFS